jgi:hypothetical protein
MQSVSYCCQILSETGMSTSGSLLLLEWTTLFYFVKAEESDFSVRWNTGIASMSVTALPIKPRLHVRKTGYRDVTQIELV